MKGLINHFIISMYNVEDEIKENLIKKHFNTCQDSDEEIDEIINQLFEEL